MVKPLLITYEYPPDYGGIAKYLEQEVYTFNGQVKIVRAQDYEMSFWLKWIPLLWHTFYLLRKNQCNSIWLSHILPIGYIALIYKKIFKIPYRIYVHGLDLVRPKKSKWKTFWVRIILNNADEIICNSNATARLLQYYDIKTKSSHKFDHLKIQYPRIKKIETQKYQNIGIDLRKKYNIENKKILLTVSRLVKRKGIDFVIRSLPEVWKQIPDLVYVIIGDGEDAGRLRALAQSVSVIFTGSVSDKEKYGWLSACNCFILTPIDDPDDFEGYGIVYKEAQMFSKPVIGSYVGGVPEAIGNSGTLILSGNVDQIVNSILKNVKS